MSKEKAITLISLVITIIVMLILAGVTINVITEGNILGKASEAVEKDKISKAQYDLQEEVIKIATSGVREISMEKLIDRLEKKGVIVLGNTVNGQVITEEGYIFEIKLRAYRDIEVNYIGKGDLPEGTTLSLTPSTTGIAKKVTITVKGISTDGIKSYTPPTGTAKTYSNTPRTISETYEVTENGTYTFKITDSKNNEITESITISNVLAGTIQMSANKTTPTKDDVIVTITWPINTGNTLKQVKVGDGEWQKVTGATNQVTVKENITVSARVINSIGEMLSASVTIDNIERNIPIVSPVVDTITIEYGTGNDMNNYFTVEANGIAEVSETKYLDTSNGNIEVENTNTLTVGTHIIKCVAIKETGAMASATIEIIVEPLVFANLYKISETEYHLIFNGTGEIAEGYSEEQLIEKSENIKDGIWYTVNEDDTIIAYQPWLEYLESITKVKIEETLKPTNTACYFRGLTQITEIEGISNIDTSKVTDMCDMFCDCKSLENLDVSGFDTSKVTDMRGMFYMCGSLTNLDVSSWNTSNVTNMQAMFDNCNKVVSLDVSSWNTENVTNTVNMFLDCSSLTSLDVSSWNTSNVTDMEGMFARCSKLMKIYASEKWSNTSVTSSKNMFLGSNALSGAISYASNKLDATYANYTTGYFTRDKGMGYIYFEDFYGTTYSNYRYSGASVVSCENGVLKLKSTNADPMMYIKLSTNQYFNPKEYRYLHVRYKITSNATDMGCFMVPSPSDDTYFVSKTLTTDGEWNTAVFDLSSNSAVWGLSQITGMRFDPINISGATIEIDYIGVSTKSE